MDGSIKEQLRYALTSLRAIEIAMKQVKVILEVYEEELDKIGDFLLELERKVKNG